MEWGQKPYYSLNHYFQQLYKDKVYKIALNGGFTCPNRDGTKGTKGCIFCSEGGSGEFAGSSHISISNQIEEGKALLSNKKTGKYFVAYFQAFTNTYGPLSKLEALYYEAIQHPDIVGLFIATRPDCLSPEIIHLLSEINKIKKVWIELGLQTVHDRTAQWMRRGYDLNCFEKALVSLSSNGLEVIVHLIIGLPYETKEDLMATIDYIGQQTVSGVKLQLLHVLKDTDLGQLYNEGNLSVLSMDDYVDLVIDCIERLPPHMVIHRLTGDGPKSLLLAPLWSTQKKLVLNHLLKRFKTRATYQGKYFNF